MMYPPDEQDLIMHLGCAFGVVLLLVVARSCV